MDKLKELTEKSIALIKDLNMSDDARLILFGVACALLFLLILLVSRRSDRGEGAPTRRMRVAFQELESGLQSLSARSERAHSHLMEMLKSLEGRLSRVEEDLSVLAERYLGSPTAPGPEAPKKKI